MSSLPIDSPAVTGFAPLLRGFRSGRRLSQLQLAGAAELSQRHLSFLEVGRARPSRAMVLQLAQALDLPLRERNRLLVAAGYAPLYPQRRLDAPDMAAVRGALEHLLRHHEPYPALVVDRQWNLLLINAACTRLIGLIGEPDALWTRCCGQGPRNLMKLLLHPQGLRPAIVNLDEVSSEIVLRLERESLDNDGAAALLAELRRDYGLRSHTAPSGQAPAPVLSTHFRFGAKELRLFGVFSTFGTPQDLTLEELRVETLFPADAASESLLRLLASAG